MPLSHARFGLAVLLVSAVGCAGIKAVDDAGTTSGAAGASHSGGGGSSVSGGGGATGNPGTGGRTTGTAGAGGSPAAGGAGGQTFCVNQGPDCIPMTVCQMKTIPVERLPPEILIVFDRSVSMVEMATGGSCGVTKTCGTKWQEMSAGVEQVVMQTETTIDWGLKFFADSGACGVAPAVTVPVAPNNSQAITAALTASAPGGHTPTQLAMQAGTAYLKARTTPNEKFILLATDGIPNCIPGAAKQTTYDTVGAPQAVTDALTMGIPTFVVGVGTPAGSADSMVFEPTLTALAKAGGRERMATPNYYHVSGADDVVAAVKTIQSQVNSCSFNLGQVPPDPNNIAVEGDGARIPKDTTHVNGWDYTPDMKTVQLYGTWCDQVKTGTTKNVQVIFGCPGVIIP